MFVHLLNERFEEENRPYRMKEKRSKNEGARGCECVIAIEDN